MLRTAILWRKKFAYPITFVVVRNYIGQTVLLPLLIVLLLTALSLRPAPVRVLGIEFKPVDMFESVRLGPDTLPAFQDEAVRLVASDTLDILLPDDSPAMPEPLPPVNVVFFGRILEDYTFDQRGLDRFFAAIDSIRTQQRSVRIAFFGDSFIEGDIVLGDLRDTLQSVWGGRGVGMMPVTSVAPGFRRTCNHQFRGWKTHSIAHNNTPNLPFGIDGNVYVPGPDAHVHYESSKHYANTRQWSVARLFYRASEQQRVVWRVNGAPEVEAPLPGTVRQVAQVSVEQPGMHDVRLRFPASGSVFVYGVSLEDGPGVYVDNFAVRGNHGGLLRKITVDMARDFDELLQYDLVIMQFGLNAATRNWSATKTEWYRKELDRAILHLKACFPGRTIVLFSIADRAERYDGMLRTMPAVRAIANMQRDLARHHGLIFFDLFHAMGGEQSIVHFASTSPPLANKDFTHLTHQGGRLIGRQIGALLLDAHREGE